MNVVLPIAGGLLILVTAREVFHTLFHPAGQGSITLGVFRLVSASAGRLGRSARPIAGPLSMVLIIALWAGALIIGFALVYWPSMPERFAYSSVPDAAGGDGLLDAIYYSWVTQSTLGYGSITPEHDVLRVLAPLQATLGFLLLTLVVTWVLSVYPALQRRRAAASAIHALRLAHERAVPAGQTHPATLARQLGELSRALHQIRVDFIQYPTTFYFAAPGPTLSLARGLPWVADLARPEGLGDEAAPAAAELEATLELLAAVLAEQHLRLEDAGTDEVLAAFGRRHHGDEGRGA